MMRFERFTEAAQDVTARGYEILQRYQQNQLDTGHLLLGMLEQAHGTVPGILTRLGVDVDALHDALGRQIAESPKAAIYGTTTNQVFITPRVKRIIDVANDEASKMRAAYIGVDHLFLAVLAEQNTPIAKLLAQFKISRDEVYAAIVAAASSGASELTSAQRDAWEKITAELLRLALERNLHPDVGVRALQFIELLTRHNQNSS